MKSINVAGILQEEEVGDADSRACTRSQVQVKYFIIPCTSTFNILYHLDAKNTVSIVLL